MREKSNKNISFLQMTGIASVFFFFFFFLKMAVHKEQYKTQDDKKEIK